MSNTSAGATQSAMNSVGQSFTATCTGNLLTASIYITAITGPITNATVSVWVGDDGTQTGTQVGTSLTGVTLVAASLNTFDLSGQGITVTNSSVYTIILDDNGDTDDITFYSQGGDPYAFGTQWDDGGQKLARDIDFSVDVCAAPTAAATSAVFGTETISTIDLTSWTAPAGGADGYLVFMNSANSFTSPSNGDGPATSTVWADAGAQAIYFGTSNSPTLTITGLDDGTTYYFQIYSYFDCTTGFELYETSGLNSNDITTATVPTFTATWLDAGDGNIDQVRLDFSEDVTISDGGAGGDGFDAITISGATISNGNYASGTTTSLLLDITGITGTATSATVTYSNAVTSHILSDDTSTEVDNTDTPTLYIDGAAPVLIAASSTPLDGTTDVAINTDVVLTFSENVVAGTGDITLVDVTGTGTDDRVITLPDAQLVFSTNTLTINPSTDLVNINNYAVNVAATAVDDGTGNSYAGLAGNTAMDFTTIGAIPTFTATWLDNSGDGNIDQLQLDFSEAVSFADGDGTTGIFDAITVTGGVTLTNAGSVDYSTVTGVMTYTFDVTGVTGTADPGETIAYATGTQNTITADAGGQPLNSSPSSVIDGAAPVLIAASSTPLDDATDVAINTDVVLTFSENVQAGTGNITLVDVTNGGTDTRAITLPDAQLVFSTNTLTINPSSDLDNLVNYAVNVAATAIDDASASTNSYAGIGDNTTMDFTTIGATPTFTATWLGDGAGNIDRVQLTFNVAVNITDADGAGGEGLPGIVFGDANTIDVAVDYSTATYDNFTSEIFDLTTPYVGTASPAVTITYTAAAFTANDISATAANGGLEVGDAAAGGYTDGAAPVVISAVTDDTDRNGQIDRMTFTFSESIDDGNSGVFDNTTVDISGYAGETKVSVDDDNAEVIISFFESGAADTDATPNVNLQVGQVEDGDANSVGSIQILAATDGAAPAIISAVTADDGNGEIDQITITLSEDIDGVTLDTDGGSDDFTVSGYTVASVAANSTDGAIITLTESGTPDTGVTPSIDLGISDIEDLAAANNSLTGVQTFTGTTDGAAPVIYDSELQSSNSYVQIVFSEVIGNGGATIAPSDFDITINLNAGNGPTTLTIAGINDFDGNPIGISEDTLRFDVNIDPAVGTYGGDDDITISTDGTTIEDLSAGTISLAGSETVGPFTILDNDNFPTISTADYTRNSSTQGYITITFSEAVRRDGHPSRGVNLGNSDSGEIKNGEWSNGDSDCDGDELCADYTQNSSPITGETSPVVIGDNNDSDIRWQEDDGTTLTNNNHTYTGPSFRLLFRDINSEEFRGYETYKFEARDETQINSVATGKFMPDGLDYFFTFTFPDNYEDPFDGTYAAVAAAYDVDGDGNIDEVLLTMPDDIDDATIAAALGDFDFGGETPDELESIPLNGVDPGTPNDHIITLSFNTFTGTAVGSNTLDFTTGNLTDDAGNNFLTGSISVDDAAGPVVTSVTTLDTDLNGSIDRVAVLFSEPIFDVATAFTSFVLDGGSTYTPNGFAISGSTINVDFPEPGGYDTDAGGFNVEIDPGIVEDAANAPNPDQTGGNAVAVTDGAAPYVTITPTGAVTTGAPALTGIVDDPLATVLVSVGSNVIIANNDGLGAWTVSPGDYDTPLAVGGPYEAVITAFDVFANIGNDNTSTEVGPVTGGVIVGPSPVFNICIGDEVTLSGASDITLDESNNADFVSDGTYTINLPAGFEFNTSASVSITDNNGDVNVDGWEYLGTAGISIDLTVAGSSSDDIITISGLTIKAVGATARSNKAMTLGGSVVLTTGQTVLGDLSSSGIEAQLTNVQETSGGTFVTEWVAKYTPTTVIPHAVVLLGDGAFSIGESVTFSGGAVGTVVATTGSQIEVYFTSGTTVGNGEIITGNSTETALVNALPTAGSGYLPPFGFTASPNGVEAQWWNAVTDSYITNAASVTNADLGMTSPGVYSIDVYDYNGSCLNAPLRLKVLIYEDIGPAVFDLNSFEDRSFVADNDPETFYLSQPAGTTASVSGAGISTANPGATELKVTFDPSAVISETTHVITYTIANDVTGDSFDVTVNFTVSDPSQTFAEIDLPADVLGVDDLPITLTLKDGDWEMGQTLNFFQFVHENNTTNFIHYEADYANNGITEYVEVFDPRSTHFDVAFDSWNRLKPISAGRVANGGSHVEIPDGSAEGFVVRAYLSNPLLATTQALLVYGAPLVAINNLNTTYCYNDVAFDLSREVTYASGIDGPIDNPAPFSSSFTPVIENVGGVINNGYYLYKKNSTPVLAQPAGSLLSNTPYVFNPALANNSIYMVDVYDAGSDGINFVDAQNRYFRLIDNNGDIVAQIGNEAFSEKNFYFETGAGPGQFALPITVQMYTDNSGAQLSFEIYQYTEHADFTSAGGNLQNDFNPSDLNQNGTSTALEGENGTYRILYETEPLTPADIVGYSVHEVIINPPATAPDLRIGHGLNWNGAPWYDNTDINNGMSTIMMEFCNTTDMSFIVGDLAAGAYSYNWYWADQNSLLQGALGYIPISQAFDDPNTSGTTEVPTPGTTTTFWFERIENGCTSPKRKIEVFIYGETETPVATTNGNAEDVNSDGSRYVYEFCDTYTPITLNTLDEFGSTPVASSGHTNAYFNIYRQDNTFIKTITSSTLNAIDFEGLAAINTKKTFYVSQVWNDASNLAGIWRDEAYRFSGCESALVQFDVTVFDSPSVAGAVDAPSLGAPKIDICKGEAFGDVLFSNLGIDKYVFREAGKGIVLEIESGDVLNIDDLQNSASDFNRNNVGIYNYGLSRVSNIGTETDFPGCESGIINFSVEVHEIYDEVDIASLDYTDADPDATEYLYEVCLSELDQTDVLTVSSTTPTLNKEFIWYSTDLNGDNEVVIPLVNSVSPTFQDLGMGLGDVSDGNIKYFEVTQRTDIDDFIGCEGPPVFIKVTFSDLDALSVDMPGPDNNYCYDEEADFDMVLREGGTPVGASNVILYEVRLTGTSTIIDLDPGAGVTPASGMFAYPTADLDSWLVAGGGDADLVGGSPAVLDVYFEYLHPTLGCTGTHIETLTIFPKPDLTFKIADQDVSLVDFDDDAGTDYDEFCYDEGDILLEGLFADGTGLTRANGGQFVIVRNADDSFSAETDDILLSTNNNRAFFNPAAQHGPDPFLAQTSHLIQFEYVDGEGCDNFVEQLIFVNPRPKPSGVLNTSQIQFTQICEGETTEAYIDMFVPGTGTLVSDYTGYTFDWTTSGVDQLPIVNSNTITFDVATSNISFQVIVTDPNGCQVTVTENHSKQALPVLAIPAIVDNQEFCTSRADVPLVLKDGGVDAALADITWSIDSYNTDAGSGAISQILFDNDGGSNPTIDMSVWHVAAGGNAPDGFGDIVGGPSTVHTITMTYQDNTRSYQGVSTQCSNTIVRTITINPLPDISFAVEFLNELEGGYSETFCYDYGLVSLQGIFADGSDLTGGIGSFSGPGVVPTGNSLATWNPQTAHGPNQHAAQSNSVITFTYTDPNGCQYAVSKTLNVDPLPDPVEVVGGPEAGERIKFTEICEGSPITAYVELVDPTNPANKVTDYSDYTFAWDLPNDALDVQATAGSSLTTSAGIVSITGSSDANFITYSSGTVDFSIEVTVTRGTTGCGIFLSEDHEQQPLPDLDFTVISDGDSYCQEDNDLTLIMSTNTGIIGGSDLANLSYSVTSTGPSSKTFSGLGNPTIDFDVWHSDVGGDVVGGSPTTHVITMTYQDLSNNQYQNELSNCTNEVKATIIIHPKPVVSFTYEQAADAVDNEVCIDEERLTLVSSLAEQTGQTVSTFSVAGFPSTALEDNNNGTAHIAIEQLFLDAIAGGVLDDSGATASRSSRSITVDIDLFFEDAISCTNIVTQTVIIHNLPVPVYDITQNGSSLVSGTLVEVCIDDLSEVNAANINKILLIDATNQSIQGARTAATFTENNYNLGAASLENIGTTGQAYFYPRAAIQAAEVANATLVGATSIDFVFDMSYTNEFGCVGKTRSTDAEAGVQDFDNRLTIRVYRTPKPVVKVDFNGFALTENEYCIDQDIAADPIRLFVESIGFDTGVGSGGTFVSDPALSSSALYGAVVNNSGFDQIYFDPALAYDEHPNANSDNGDVAVFEISYVYNTSDKSCANDPSTSVVTITINPKPFVEFVVDFGVGVAGNEFCIDNGLEEIQGKAYDELSQTTDITDQGLGRFSSNFIGSPGVIATTNNLADFNFQTAFDDQEERTHTVTYTYTKTSTGCTNSVSQDIIINTKPIVDINSVGGCDRTPVELEFTTLETAPGDQVVAAFWDFDDIASEEFEPGSNTSTDIIAKHTFSEAGEYFVSLVATSEKGCSSVETTEQLQVGDIPDVNFTMEGLCEGSEITFVASPTSVNFGTVETVLFNFGDGSPLASIDTQGNPDNFTLSHTYADPGVFDTQLILITNNNCEQIHNRTINILPNELVTSVNPYFVDFEDVVPVSKDYYEIVYNENTLSRDTTFVIETGVVIEAAGWSVDLRPLDDKEDVDYWGKLPRQFNSWQFGIPAGTLINNNVSDHGNVWSTNLDGNYLGNEAISWVYSPCFDFENLERPMVSFDQSYHFPDARDGVVLQYSVDGGATWLVLGNYNPVTDDATGIKWFTDENIFGVPGEQSGNVVGWAGNNNLPDDTAFAEWVSSRHKLDEIAEADRGSVIFRFALGSDGSAESEGYAFDNFRIDERKKNVLLEQFSSTNLDDSRTVAENIEEIINDETINKGDIIAINYHTSFAGEFDKYEGNPPILQNPDPISIVNLDDPSARTAYYGIATAPNSVLDGDEEIVDEATAKTSSTDILWDKNDIARNSLKDAKFDIVINDDFGSDEGVIDVNVTAEAEVGINGGEVTELALYIAIIEKDVDISAGAFDRNGQTITHNALRKMLPSGIGSRYEQVFPAGTILNVSETWDISKDVDASDLAIVAFVQNVDTKVIYQTVTKDVVGKVAPTITGIGDEFNNEGYNLYPNPANQEVFIVFDKTTIEVMDWSVYDQTGKVYKLGKLKPGAGGFSLETEDFPSGMYFISITGENLKFSNSKFIITH